MMLTTQRRSAGMGYKLEHNALLLIDGVRFNHLTPAEALREVKKHLNITH